MIPTYHVKVLASRQELEVSLAIAEAPQPSLTLEVPTWVPGAYAFLRYARDVFEVSADGGQISRDGWSSFRVDGVKPGAPLTVRWIAGMTDPAWSELAGFVRHDQAILLATRYLAVAGHAGPVRVSYELPAGWELHHPGGAKKLDERSFEYASFAQLLDMPIACGRFDRRTRELAGTTFHHVFLDRAYGFEKEADAFVSRVMKQAALCKELFGGFPCDDYTFVYSFDPRARWGLEHASSTMVGLGELALVDPEERFAAVRVCGHELLHAWNVCRMKPAALASGSLDLVRGSFPDELWIAEGWTRYYELVLAVRAGEIDAQRFFSNVARYFATLTGFPSYGRAAVVDSSRATFLNHHHWPGMINAAFDYYGYGMLVAFDLDVALRTGAAGEPLGSLDEELRSLWTTFGARAAGYTQAEVMAHFAERRPALAQIARRETEGKAALSVPARLEALGFDVEWEERPRLGVVLDERRPGTVTNVADDSPAAAAGLACDDEIVRVDGLAYLKRGLLWAVANQPRIAIEVRRGHAFHTFEVAPVARRAIKGLVWRGADADAARLRSWLGSAEGARPFAAGDRVGLDHYDNFHGTYAVI